MELVFKCKSDSKVNKNATVQPHPKEGTTLLSTGEVQQPTPDTQLAFLEGFENSCNFSPALAYSLTSNSYIRIST